MVSVARKLSKVEERGKAKVVCFGENVTEKRSETLKLRWVRVPVKLLGLGIIFSYDIQRYVSNGHAYDKLSEIEIYKKCKDMSNFPAVTLRAQKPCTAPTFRNDLLVLVLNIKQKQNMAENLTKRLSKSILKSSETPDAALKGK
jgi:hypothetical protein